MVASTMIPIQYGVGEGGANKVNEVTLIDDLLRTAGVLRHPAPNPSARIEAIKKFQDIWKIPRPPSRNGLITPRGATLRRLRQTVSGLNLNPIRPAPVSRGGYSVSFEPEAPPAPYELFLGLDTAKRGSALAPDQCIHVTGCKRHDVFTPDNLPSLLRLISARGAWSPNPPLKFRLFVVKDGIVVSESKAQELTCPVRPHKGALLPMENDVPPKIKYVFKPSDMKRYHGRWLHEIRGLDELFFTEKGVFEFDPEFRGFACIGYASLACGMPFEHLKEAKVLDEADAYSGEDLARYMKASPCTFGRITLEKADAQNVIDFFKTNPPGYYLVWSGTHVMLATGGYIHEFNQVENKNPPLSIDGYGCTDIETRLTYYKTVLVRKLTVRQLPGKPARAR